MVTYQSGMRYSEALAKGRIQEEIMKKIMSLPDIEKKWNSEEVEILIQKHLSVRSKV